MPIRYIEFIREIQSQYYREFIYKHQLVKIRKQFVERLELLNKEIRNIETDILNFKETDEIVTIASNYYKKALISDQSRLIEHIQEIDLDITYTNSRLKYQTKLSKKYLNLNHLG